MLDYLLRYFETRVDVFQKPVRTAPPEQLVAFYRHFVGQARAPLLALLFMGGFLAVQDVTVPWLMGAVIDAVALTPPEQFLAQHWHLLAFLIVLLLVVFPLSDFVFVALFNQSVFVPLMNLVRWQSHRHVLGHDWSYFQNDFAGRIASKVMETGVSVRGSVITAVGAIWYVLIYALGTLFVLSTANVWLIMPLVCWLIGYALIVRISVPVVQDRSLKVSEARSALTGRIVDSYTNVLTVKLFAARAHEDEHVREAVATHTEAMRHMLRRITYMDLSLSLINTLLVCVTTMTAIYLWTLGMITPGEIAMTLPLILRITAMSDWILREITDLFENIGTVEEGMTTIAKPHGVVDAPNAPALSLQQGEIRFEQVHFNYRKGDRSHVLQDFNLTIKPGEKVGLVGRSGAGKSTLVNLLLRFFDVEAGRVLIDDQDVRAVTQDSLRGVIGMVTQDTSLLHRSLRDNIRYGRPDASEDEIMAAVTRAKADQFLPGLEDAEGRSGLDAHVGERGVKLSGGQRQRIAIARVILKDAPILVLDEATSALDSEVEAAIQESLYELMQGRSVIAIAHRLSTIAKLDRLVIMDEGRIVEQGTHDELLAINGLYAQLWRLQSGGFLGEWGPISARAQRTFR